VAREYGLVWDLPQDLRDLHLQFGIDLEAHNGDTSWTLPMPARYVIDRERTVRWASVSPDYTMRPDPTETIEALRRL
jgi:peroxiredoxin